MRQPHSLFSLSPGARASPGHSARISGQLRKSCDCVRRRDGQGAKDDPPAPSGASTARSCSSSYTLDTSRHFNRCSTPQTKRREEEQKKDEKRKKVNLQISNRYRSHPFVLFIPSDKIISLPISRSSRQTAFDRLNKRLSPHPTIFPGFSRQQSNDISLNGITAKGMRQSTKRPTDSDSDPDPDPIQVQKRSVRALARRHRRQHRP